MRRRGLSLMEAVLAIAILLIAFLVFMSVFSSSSRTQIQTRNRTAAILLANSLMDEFEAHPYGSPEPKWWSSPVDQPVKVWVHGKPVQMDFHKKLEYENGSFVGKAEGDTDVVKITISWREAAGDAQPGVVDPGDNKVLTARFPVWR